MIKKKTQKSTQKYFLPLLGIGQKDININIVIFFSERKTVSEIRNYFSHLFRNNVLPWFLVLLVLASIIGTFSLLDLLSGCFFICTSILSELLLVILSILSFIYENSFFFVRINFSEFIMNSYLTEFFQIFFKITFTFSLGFTMFDLAS